MKTVRDQQKIIRDFKYRQGRQFFAIGVTLVLLLVSALVYTRSDVFGTVSKNAVFAAQLIAIIAFVVFSAVNWRCPSCGKYLGSDITRRACKHCGCKLG